MSKKPNLDPVDIVLEKSTFEEELATFVEKSAEPSFPDVSEISTVEPYVSPFKIPSWVNQVDYAFCWIDLRDDRARADAESKYWALVKRISPCVKQDEVPSGGFRAHGAVEMGRQFLHYRPIDLNRVMRERPERQHINVAKGFGDEKKEVGYELKGGVRRHGEPELDGEKMTRIFAEETPGVEGLVKTGDI